MIEPFGYGLSSQTKRERSAQNIVEEIHEVVEILNIDSFILMGHSIAGIYGLNYVNTYPENVQAFVGIDSTVPVYMLNMKNFYNETIANEGKLQEKIVTEAMNLHFPKELPLLLFVAVDNTDGRKDEWINLHKVQSETVTKGEVVALQGSHLLHYTQSKAITEGVKNFMDEK